jgi:threonine/homoserine/homoserine lactone efflux protein
MESSGWIMAAILLIYIAICFGKIAAKHGKNPFLYGVLSIIGPINLIILGYWAFSDFETQEREKVFVKRA